MEGVENIYTTVLVTPSRSCSSWLYFILPFRSISTHCRLQDLTQSQLATEHSYLPVESSSLFFSNRRHSRSRWYLGIWYKKVSKKTYAWAANRDNPLSDDYTRSYFWSLPTDDCDLFSSCGPNDYCDQIRIRSTDWKQISSCGTWETDHLGVWGGRGLVVAKMGFWG